MRLLIIGLWRKFQEAKNAWRFNNSRRMATQITTLILGLLVAAAISTSARIALLDGVDEGLVVMTGNFAAFTALTVVFTLSRALNDLFLAQDFELLASAPVSYRDILLSRIGEMALSNLPLALVFTLPSMTVLVPLAASPFFLPMGLLFIVMQVLAITAVSTLLLLALTRLAPPRLLKQVVYVVWTVGFLAFYLWANIRLGDGASPVLPYARLGQGGLGMLAAWASQGTVSFFLGDLGAGLRYLSYMFLLACSSVLFSAQFLAGMVFTGRAALGNAGDAKAKSRSWRGLDVLPPQLRAMTEKELVSFTRDVRELTGILYALTLVVLFAWRMPGFGGAIGFVVLPTALFAGNFQIRTSLPAFGREGKQWLLLQSAPLSPKDLVRAKFAPWAIVSGIASVLLAVILGMVARFGFMTLVFMAYYGLAVGLVAVAVALQLGARFADFDAERPEEYVLSSGRWAALLATIGLTVGGWLATLPLESIGGWFGYTLSLVTVGALSGLVITFALAACERHIAVSLTREE